MPMIAEYCSSCTGNFYILIDYSCKFGPGATKLLIMLGSICSVREQSAQLQDQWHQTALPVISNT